MENFHTPVNIYPETCNKHFVEVFNEIETQISFDARWANSTGYFNNAVYSDYILPLSVGQRVKCVDDFGRRMILVGTRFGNVVAFERYTASHVIVSNESKEIELMFPEVSSSWSADTIKQRLSAHGISGNIGLRTESIAAVFGM